MDAGLLSMYVALMLLGLGMIVFSKIEDKKKGKYHECSKECCQNER